MILPGCRATKIQTSASSHRTDSVTVRETIRDTAIVVERDSSMIRALLECDSVGQVRMRELLEYRSGERVKIPNVKIRDNVLTATAEVDSMTIFLQLKDRYTREVSRSEQAEETVRTIEVNRVTWWQQMWIRIGQSLFVALAGFIAFKLFKPKITLLWQTILTLLKKS